MPPTVAALEKGGAEATKTAVGGKEGAMRSFVRGIDFARFSPTLFRLIVTKGEKTTRIHKDENGEDVSAAGADSWGYIHVGEIYSAYWALS